MYIEAELLFSCGLCYVHARKIDAPLSAVKNTEDSQDLLAHMKLGATMPL
jgi:hypothetical protein